MGSILLIFVVIASGCGNTEEDSGNEESASQESNEPVVLERLWNKSQIQTLYKDVRRF